MDIYHIWCNLKQGINDLDFVEGVRAYLEHLRDQGELHSYRITRAKLGLRPAQLREFHITLEFQDLAQMQTAFNHVSSRSGLVEELHHAVNSKVQDTFFALYRDFPEHTRVSGQERF